MRCRLPIAFYVVFVACGVDVHASNSVLVESKTVLRNEENVTVGVYVENDYALANIVLPLELRSLDSGAFIVNHLTLNPTGRIATSGLMNLTTELSAGQPVGLNPCSGPASHSYSNDSPPDFVTPDAVMWSGLALHDPNLSPGNDGTPGSGDPSFVLTFDVGSVTGDFVIDTCCWTAATHIWFADASPTAIIPVFTKGTISIADSCDCSNHVTTPPPWWQPPNVLDVVRTVNVAFKGFAPTRGDFCNFDDTDADCNGHTDVLDVVHVVNVAFRGGDPATEFCNPCNAPLGTP